MCVLDCVEILKSTYNLADVHTRLSYRACIEQSFIFQVLTEMMMKKNQNQEMMTMATAKAEDDASTIEKERIQKCRRVFYFFSSSFLLSLSLSSSSSSAC